MRRSFLMMMAALLAVSGCSTNGGDVAPEAALTQLRASVAERNYGQALQQAREVVREYPNDPRPRFEQARAEALMGNDDHALTALAAALARGLEHPAQALADPAFATLRAAPEFAELARQYAAQPGAPGATAAPAALTEPAVPPPRDNAGPMPFTEHLAAGSGSDRVEILGGEDGEIIRAGDVELRTRF